MSTVKWKPCTTPFRLVFERVPVNSLAPVWSVFLMWFGSLWVWEGDIGLWLELQLKHFWCSQGQGEKEHKHSHILQEGKVDVQETAPCRITWRNVTIWIHSALNLQDLWGVDSHLVWSYHEPYFWPCCISVSVLRRQFPSLTFPLVCVAAGMLGLCECIDEGLHCCVGQPSCLLSSHKSFMIILLHQLSFISGKSEFGYSRTGGYCVDLAYFVFILYIF